MNVRERYDLGGYYWSRGERKINCNNIREFLKKNGNVGNSVIFKANVLNCEFLRPEEAHKGDLIYFKANSQVGVNANGRNIMDEARGSCEDVAEVLAYYILDEMIKKYGDRMLIEPTPYFFAEYESEYFGEIVHKQTGGLLDIYRLYGCASSNIIPKGGDIVHGADVLQGLFSKEYAFLSRNNTIYNYAVGLEQYAQKHGLVLDPSIPRRLCNLMFWDYFYCNSDRHCQNINFQTVPMSDGRKMLQLSKILDNGGGLLMQNTNCEEFLRLQEKYIQQDGEIKEVQEGLSTQFNVQYDLSSGKELFADEKVREQFDGLEYEEQLVFTIASNRTLFNDFKMFYEGVDLNEPLKRLKSRTSTYFLPELDTVLPEAFKYKKMRISKVISKVLQIPFDEELFKNDPNHYVNLLDKVVPNNELTIQILSDEEIQKFNEQNVPQIDTSSAPDLD